MTFPFSPFILASPLSVPSQTHLQMVNNMIFFILFAILGLFLILRLLAKTSLFHILLRLFRSFEDLFHVYQSYKVPQLNDLFQENEFFHKVFTYLNSLPSLEDSDYTNLFTGSKSNDIVLHLDTNQTIRDTFLGARVTWTTEKSANGRNGFVLILRKNDKRRILRPYLQHILSIADEIDQRKKQIKLRMNVGSPSGENGRWISVKFNHPASFDTLAMDVDLKNKIKADLETFLKSKQFYHRLGRVWKRSYLLYGASGTGKSSFIAAMAKFLHFDVYDIDLSKVSDDSDLKMLLLQTTRRSILVVEDLDRFLMEKKPRDVSLLGILNFMDGIISCCGEERVMVFTMNSKDQVDHEILRPGRIDVHIQFPLCDFSAFKSLANSYLGVKEHKLFPQVEEIFLGGASLSPAEIGEIMISNRSSPTRALKSVITALQTSGSTAKRGNKRLSSDSDSVRNSDESGDQGNPISRENSTRDFRKLYGLLKMGSRRREEPIDLGLVDKEGSRH